MPCFFYSPHCPLVCAFIGLFDHSHNRHNLHPSFVRWRRLFFLHSEGKDDLSHLKSVSLIIDGKKIRNTQGSRFILSSFRVLNWSLECLVYNQLHGQIVLNAELKSTISILMQQFSFSRCVKTERRAVDRRPLWICWCWNHTGEGPGWQGFYLSVVSFPKHIISLG